eukprot:12442895-Heterocapsa_arctica.AAC.1
MEWEVSLWEGIFPAAVAPEEELDEEFWLNLLEPEVEAQEEEQMLAIMDEPQVEAPTEDRPNLHAGVRIGEASNPGPPKRREKREGIQNKKDRKKGRKCE